MSQYRDPSTERLSDGRSIADLIPGRTRGIQGVIVGPSTRGGVPINYNPHDLSNLEITVEPDGPGKTVLKFGQYSKEEVAVANAEATAKFPGQDIESQRERALYALQLLSRPAAPKTAPESLSQRSPRFPRKPEKQAMAAATDMAEDEEDLIAELESELDEPTTPPIEKIDRGYSPMAAFGLKKKSGLNQPPAAAPTSQRVGPPQKLVYFEKEGIGTVPAFFHDIISAVSYTDDTGVEESGFMVLIYDIRFEQSAARWFPPSNDPYNRPWAVQIANENKLYLVHTTGFQYVYDNREYCILLVEKAVVPQD